MSAETTSEVAEAFDTLADHCLTCHDCRAEPNQMCPESQRLYRAWKTVWKET